MIKSFSETFRFVEPSDCADCENGMQVLDIVFKNIEEEPTNMDEWLMYTAGYDIGYGYYYNYDIENKELLVTLESNCEESI